MYGESKITTDVLLTAPATFATNQAHVAAGGSLRFSVEEEEMLTVLEFQGVLSSAAIEGKIDATFFVDSVDQGPLVDGLVRVTAPTVALDPTAVYMKLTKRFPQGQHRVEVRFKSAADVNVLGALHPATLSATRLSMNSTLAPNMTSKQVSGVY